MPQFARPSVDTANPGAWTDQVGGGVNIYTTIDEVVADDGDYIRSPLAPSSAVYVAKLSTVEDPQSNVNHTMRYRYQKDAAGGATVNLTVQLRQGYVNEGAPGTLIHEVVLNDIPNGWTTGTYTLTALEADAITDYASLYLRMLATQV